MDYKKIKTPLSKILKLTEKDLNSPVVQEIKTQAEIALKELQALEGQNFVKDEVSQVTQKASE